MLEYGKAFLEANERIIDEMTARMSPGAVAIARRMAKKAAKAKADQAQAAGVHQAA